MSDEDKGAVEEEIDVLLLLPLRRHGGLHQHIYLHAAYTPCIRINTATKTPFLIIASDAAILRVMVFPCRNRQGELSGPAGAVVFPLVHWEMELSYIYLGLFMLTGFPSSRTCYRNGMSVFAESTWSYL